MKKIFFFLFSILAFSCKKNAPLFTLLPSSETGITFQNIIKEDERHNLVDYHTIYNGAGVSVGDINNDGLSDLYFTSNMNGDKLYLNKGGLQFKDITAQAGIIKKGWSSGVTMADVNADGFLDIYVCKSGNYKGSERANQLYINDGNGYFEEKAKDFGLADTTFTNQAAFFDYDKDGDLDVYLLTTTPLISNTTRIEKQVSDGNGLSCDKLYQNNGNNTFTEVSKKAGILHNGFGLGIAIADINDDGWDDILVSNDFITNDHLYINNQNGTFNEAAKDYFKHQCRFSMGNDVADFNNDGLLDIIQVDMLPSTNEQLKKMTGAGHYEQYEVELNTGFQPQFMRNMLQLNLGKTPDGHIKFAEIGQFAGIHRTDWSWSPLFADFDNDGFKDLFITNGYLRDITDLDFISYNMAFEQKNSSKESVRRYMIDESLKMPSWNNSNFFFRNKGDLSFENVSQKWMENVPSVSHGAVYADLDNDGDLDLVVNNVNEVAHILKNNAPPSNYLQVSLYGSPQNRFGLGATITIFQGSKLQKQVQNVTRGYSSSVDYKLHFGLGEHAKVDSLIIVWNNGKTQKINNPQTNQILKIDYKNAWISSNSIYKSSTLFDDLTITSKVNYSQSEERYMDYNVETLLLHKLSQQGPKLTKGDVNGDGLEDFFVGGSYNHYGKLFIQNIDATFTQKSYTNEKKGKEEEDIGSIFFDADNDKDLDLYIVSGSNEYIDGSAAYQDRLYLNNGNGNFTNATQQLPKINHSGSCIRTADFDKDGDLDIFRGGRLTPTQFPMSGDSYILRNDKGSFSDITDIVASNLRKVGMVTDAQWIDLDKDSWLDLIIVGELMPITIFWNNKGKLEYREDKLLNTNGFWNCINSADFDKDGDIDLIIGNLGQNTRYKISEKEPITIYAGDYDNNGRWDAIPSYFINGVEYPISARDVLLHQIPIMRSKFKNYHDYAIATIKEVLSEDEINNKSIIKKAFLQQSIYLQNDGKGKFEIKPLPILAQIAPIQSMAIEDMNHDGNLDIILVGNAYDAEPVAGRYDAFMGLVLIGDGKGNFISQLFDKTGFVADGDFKDIAILNRKYVVIAQNSGSIKIFRIK